MGYWQRKKKKQKERKMNRPAGKVENAMRPRFPLPHRACRRGKRDDGEQRRTKKEGGLTAAIIQPFGPHGPSLHPYPLLPIRPVCLLPIRPAAPCLDLIEPEKTGCS